VASGLAKYIVSLNGQKNWSTDLMTSYIMKPFYGSKDSSGIVWELLLDAFQLLEKNTAFGITAMDGGPLNTAQEVSIWSSQFKIDARLLDVSMFMFYIHCVGLGP
jgi:hypothetical protein